MASRRWVITTPAPKTAKCPHCLRQRNVLSVYPTPIGKLCYSCLTSPYLTPRSVARGANATTSIAAIDAASRMATTVKPVAPAVGRVKAERVVTCVEAGCGRLPAHRGDHRATLQRRPKAEAAKVAGPKVRKLRPGKSSRQVAAPSGRVKRTRYVMSATTQLAQPAYSK